MNDIREASLETDSSNLPGGAIGQLLPFLMLALGGLWLLNHWDEIPAQVPMHWDAHGNVNRYVSRSPLHVAMPLILGASLCLMMHLMARMIRSASPRGAARKPSLRLMLVVEVFSAGLCCAVTLIAASNGRLLMPGVIFIGVLTIAVLATAISLFSGMPRTEPRNPAGWTTLYYSDPEDPALFVPKRSGYGYTVNFGHPAAIPVMIGLLALPIAAAFGAIVMR